MKIIKTIIISTVLIFSSAVMTSCGGDSTQTESSLEKGKEYTSAYICPMHCEGSGSEKAGECPVCGMDYVKNEEHDSDKHSHD